MYIKLMGFGFTTVAKSGNVVVRWNRVNKYLQEIGFSQNVGKDDYIPESVFYMLGMKANNETARKFQKWLAMEVVPSIRQNGSYTIKPRNTLELLELEFKAIKEVQQEVVEVKQELKNFTDTLPLLAVDIEAIKKNKNIIVVNILGGKNAPAYQDASVRAKVYADLSNEIKRQFGVYSYKSIPRVKLKEVIEIIDNYQPPKVLQDLISKTNNQI